MKTFNFSLIILGIFILIAHNLNAQASIEGIVGCEGGPPFEGAEVTCGSFTDSTDVTGYYYIDDIPPGSYSVHFNIPGYMPYWIIVDLVDGTTTELNYIIDCCDFTLEPLSLGTIIDPNGSVTKTVTISNEGDASIQWNTNINYLSKYSKAFFDVIYQVPISDTAQEIGVTCDGNYIYTTEHTGHLRKYDLDGNLIQIYPIGGFDDLVWTGEKFFACNGSSLIFELDLDLGIIYTFFIAPMEISTFTYDSENLAFVGYKFGNDIVVFDEFGILLNTIPVGPDYPDIHGLAYDNKTEDGPYLWVYGAIENNTNMITQYEFPSFIPISFNANMEEILPYPVNNESGGLFMNFDQGTGLSVLGGIIPGEWLWTVELSKTWNWLSLEPSSGSLDAGETEEIEVHFSASDLEPLLYEAEINFATLPLVASPSVNCVMWLANECLPYNFEYQPDCLELSLSWEQTSCYILPDSWNIFLDGEIVANVTEPQLILPVLPKTDYQFGVSAVFIDIGESWLVSGDTINLPTPTGLTPNNLTANPTNFDSVFCFEWEQQACVDPDYYKVFRNNVFFDQTLNNTYCDILTQPGIYEYYVTAQYYFGESTPTDTIVYEWVSTTVLPNTRPGILVYPNPVSDIVLIQTDMDIYKVELYDHLGRCVSSVDKSVDFHKINVSGFDSGLYFLKIETSETLMLQKLIIR
ncbi:MAG: T9SS type A sorting domain-containing protein [Bacteroidales bacterium]|nr:T9SS type A sorting domain-containing protein [Bacteroidales bacterium]